MLDEGKPVPIDLSSIGFEFKENSKYTFSSTLNYREAGDYHLERHYLFTTDTIHSNSVEKAVKINLLTMDSLHLEMKEQGGQQRILKLYRVE